ncbi:hypothetical protein BDV95DRAFT_598080 [Massariosphaeria phaeospora]|uniref:Uncharacterized protein n=1 Tax=Massariosphaeria phaeospora TaxID=100035 RepID=A0A7C8M1T4_9PLEO|nr:hypothetical protein BDV95DRAFT_598080 [Massariosphaeria phaeospora]
MSNPGHERTTGDGGSPERKKSPERRKSRKISSKRTDSTKKEYRGNPIKTKEERAKSSPLLGDIEFKKDNSKRGVVRPEGDLKNYIESMGIKLKTDNPTIDILSIKLGALDSLSRPDKRKMLRGLANSDKYPKEETNEDPLEHSRKPLYPKEVIQVMISNNSKQSEKFGGESTVSLATVLVLGIGLQNRSEVYNAGKDSTTGKISVHSDALFAELVGCVDADTMNELSHYLRPPLMTLEKLPDFIYYAVRQIARSQKKDRSPEPVKLAIETVNAISTVLEQLNEKTKEGEEGKEGENKRKRLIGLKSLLTRTLSKAHTPKVAHDQLEEMSRDLGCHAGLLLAGVQRYICKAQESVADKKELCDLFIEASSGFLSAIPMAGCLSASLGAAAKDRAHKWYFDNRAGQEGQLSRDVRQHFDEFISAPIFFDGEFVSMEETKEGTKENVIKVDWEEFNKWYSQVISWNEMRNEMIVWEEKAAKKERKAASKKPVDEIEQGSQKKKRHFGYRGK